MILLKNINWKTKATSNIRNNKSCHMSLNDVGLYLGDGPFKSDIGIVNLHSQKEHIG